MTHEEMIEQLGLIRDWITEPQIVALFDHQEARERVVSILDDILDGLQEEG